ncbi:MAG: LysR family transcriptional regulator [Pseudomonadota bacterium]
MNWDDLKLFLVVSRQQKLDLAGAVLHQDPTTLSRRLRRLEADVGQTLFERTRRGHVLTPEGEALAERAEAMEAITLGIGDTGEGGRSLVGKVRLGATEGFGTAFIAPILAQFVKEWPGIEIDLIALSGLVSVPKREADMSVLLTRPKAGRMKVRKLTDYSLRLYASREYLASRGPITTVDALSDHRLIGYVDDLIYSPQLRYFDEVLPGLHPGLSSPSIIAQLEMTRAGSGLCILPKFIANRHADLVPILTDAIEVNRSFWLAVHEDLADLARIKVLSEYLVHMVKARQDEF